MRYLKRYPALGILYVAGEEEDWEDEVNAFGPGREERGLPGGAKDPFLSGRPPLPGFPLPGLPVPPSHGSLAPQELERWQRGKAEEGPWQTS